MHPDRLQELSACLALRHAPQLGARTWRALLEHYGSAVEAVAEVRHWRSLGLARGEVCSAFASGSWRGAAQAELDKALALDARIVLWADPEYPHLLRMIPDPPLVLYCRGAVELLRGPSVAIVGSRKYVPEGMLAASRIGRELSDAGVTVVSGMALGIDREAHLAGLTGPGSSVAVLGTGLDRVYPARNVDVFRRLCDEGLVITEFAPGTRPDAVNFPVRNRIVAGLSLGVVVAQAAARSGSRITARLALEQGREVYAYTGPEGAPSFEGCRALAEEGAMPVTGAEAILADLAPRLRLALERRDLPPPRPMGRPRQARLDMDLPVPSAPERTAPDAAPDAAPAPGRNAGRRAAVSRASGAAAADKTAGAPPRRAAGKPQAVRKSASASSASAPASAPAVSAPAAPAPHPAPASGSSAAPADPQQAAVLAALAGDRRLHIDVLGRELGWDAARLSSVLLLLEVDGLVRQWPGMTYSLA